VIHEKRGELAAGGGWQIVGSETFAIENPREKTCRVLPRKLLFPTERASGIPYATLIFPALPAGPQV